MKKIAALFIALFVTLACVVPLPGIYRSTYPTPSTTGLPASPTATTASDFHCVVIATNLNLRKEPGTNATVDIVLNGGDVVTIDQNTPAQGNWQRVFYGDLVGWINMNYCN